MYSEWNIQLFRVSANERFNVFFAHRAPFRRANYNFLGGMVTCAIENKIDLIRLASLPIYDCRGIIENSTLIFKFTLKQANESLANEKPTMLPDSRKIEHITLKSLTIYSKYNYYSTCSQFYDYYV